MVADQDSDSEEPEKPMSDGMASNGEEPVHTTDSDDNPGRDHIADVPDGSGCTEIWEYLSDLRERERAGE